MIGTYIRNQIRDCRYTVFWLDEKIFKALKMRECFFSIFPFTYEEKHNTNRVRQIETLNWIINKVRVLSSDCFEWLKQTFWAQIIIIFTAISILFTGCVTLAFEVRGIAVCTPTSTRFYKKSICGKHKS